MASAILAALGSAGIQGAISALIQKHQLDKWAKLIWKCVLSYWVSSSAAAGGALMAGKGFGFSIGVGLLTGSVAAATAFYRDPLSKGMSIQVPKDMAEQAAVDPNLQLTEVKGGQGK